MASDLEVEAEFKESGNDPFPGDDKNPFPDVNRSEGLRISGDRVDGVEDFEDSIPFWVRRVRRNDEEIEEIKLEF